MKRGPVKWSKWKKIGEIIVDTGSIMFCDPCSVVPKDSAIQKKYRGNWHKFVQDWNKPLTAEPEVPNWDEKLPLKEQLKQISDYFKKYEKFRADNPPREIYPIDGALIVSTGADGAYPLEMRTRGKYEKEIRIRMG